MATGSALATSAGFRNILVHQYLGIDLDFVWSVVVEDLPLLKEKALELKAFLTNSSDAEE